jgi:hypothetical protein
MNAKLYAQNRPERDLLDFDKLPTDGFTPINLRAGPMTWARCCDDRVAMADDAVVKALSGRAQ